MKHSILHTSELPEVLLPIGSPANRLGVRATTYRSCPALQDTLISGRAP